MRGRFPILVMLAALVLAVALRAQADEDAPRIAIGSKNFTENRLLAEIMAQLIEDRTDLVVERRTNLGGTKVVFAALRSGEIDLYPEYTGTGWAIHLGNEERVTDPLRAYVHVDREFRRRWELEWLEPFGFGNSYGLAMPRARAEELGITRISDLRGHAAELRAGFSHEFLDRADGWSGLRAAYDLELQEVRGMEHGLAYTAIASERIDLVDTWTTDGKLVRYPLRLLEDDRHFFPPYDCAPVARMGTLARHPELEGVLSRLAFRVPAERMQALNAAVEDEGRSFSAVAHDFLHAEGLVGEGAIVDDGTDRTLGTLAFLWSQRGATLERIVEHVVLTATAVALAILAGVPLGIWLTRHERWVGGVLGATGVIQTIPSLALLAFMIPIPGMGLGARSAVAALFLYALLPIVRNAYTGIKEVEPAVIDAARGMGLRDREILRLVELPLAVRTIMAGVRTSTVISIGVATLAAFIGAGGLGDPIITGLQLDDARLVLAGAVPAAGLALVVDALLARLEARLAPPGSADAGRPA